MPAQDELVMVVPAAGLFSGSAFQGLRTAAQPYLQCIFDPGKSRYLPRALAEDDPSWKQIIPYVVLYCRDEVFCYRRGKQSTESRLVALHSIGLGGHIRQSDESLFAAPGWAAYRAAMRRELDEEVAIAAEVVDERLVAVINDDATPVGRVHFGLVHVMELGEPRAASRETKIAAPRFAPLRELTGAGAPVFETWSQLCLGHWDDLMAAPGFQPGA